MANTNKLVDFEHVKQELMRLLGHMEYQYCESHSIMRENVVTYLMQNGVTVSQPSGDSGRFKWIPVTERLPENSDYVITCSSEGLVIQDFYVRDEPIAGFRDARWQGRTVTHWMPMPGIPKGRESNG